MLSWAVDRCLMASCCGKTQGYLEAIVNEPLESRQSSNHEDPNRQTVPEASEANVAVDACHGFAAALASCTLPVSDWFSPVIVEL